MIAEINALAERRVRGAPDARERVGSGQAEVGALERDERRRPRVVGPSQLEREAVGFVLDVPAVREADRRQSAKATICPITIKSGAAARSLGRSTPQRAPKRRITRTLTIWIKPKPRTIKADETSSPLTTWPST